MLPPNIEKQLREYYSDKRGIVYPSAVLQKLVLPLDDARVNVAFPDVKGDFIFADRDTTGLVYVAFNNPAQPAFPMVGNTRVKNFPIEEIFVTNTAQAGEVANLWYGYGVDIQPPLEQNQADVNIVGADVPVPIYDNGLNVGTSFDSTALLAALTGVSMLSGGANPNGVRINYAGMQSNGALGQSANLQYAAGVVGTLTAGSIIAWCREQTADPGTPYITLGFDMRNPIIIPSGQTLSHIALYAETAALCYRYANYFIF